MPSPTDNGSGFRSQGGWDMRPLIPEPAERRPARRLRPELAGFGRSRRTSCSSRRRCCTSAEVPVGCAVYEVLAVEGKQTTDLPYATDRHRSTGVVRGDSPPARGVGRVAPPRHGRPRALTLRQLAPLGERPLLRARAGSSTTGLEPVTPSCRVGYCAVAARCRHVSKRTRPG
jgi:hypothetical protein